MPRVVLLVDYSMRTSQCRSSSPIDKTRRKSEGLGGKYPAVGMGVVEGRRAAVVRTDGFGVTFQDSQHRRWNVGEVFSDDELYESLYLLFCSGTDVRRLAPCPVGWRMLTAEGLEYLLTRAKPDNDVKAQAHEL